MGRAKVALKPIQNEKARKSTFIQRKKGLTKKVSEFSSKFGVDVCLTVYDDDGRAISWPQDSTIVQSMLEKYEQQKIESITLKEFDVKDYFAHKNNLVEAEISKVRNQIAAKKYPTWGLYFHSLGGDQLKSFIGIVDGKIQVCNQRISMLNKMQQSDETSFLDSTPQKPYILDDPLKALDEIDEMDFTNHVDLQQSETSFTENTAHVQNHVDVQQSETSFSQNTAHMQNHFVQQSETSFTQITPHMQKISQRQHISDPLKLPVSLPPVWSTNLLVEPDQEWAGRFGELVELENFVPEPDQEWGVTEFVNFDDILDNDVMNWISQQDVTLE